MFGNLVYETDISYIALAQSCSTHTRHVGWSERRKYFQLLPMYTNKFRPLQLKFNKCFNPFLFVFHPTDSHFISSNELSSWLL